MIEHVFIAAHLCQPCFLSHFLYRFMSYIMMFAPQLIVFLSSFIAFILNSIFGQVTLQRL
jgi:hypothetical protein